MPGRLAGKTAIVTGSSSGLGQAIAIAYIKEGANVCCADLYSAPRNEVNKTTGMADDYNNRVESGQSTLDILGSITDDKRFCFVKTDVSKASDVESLVRSCVEKFGRLDIMVNNAGIGIESTHARPIRIHETSEEDFDKTIAINVRGVFLGNKYAIQQMLKQDLLEGQRDRGWIVNTASVQGLVAFWGTPSYTTSKGAVVQLTKQVAVDYGPDRIHSNALCPGFLKTNMTRTLQTEPQLRAMMDQAHPFGGMGEVEDVAKAAVFLASDDAAWVTGVPLPVDGGFLTL